MRKAAVIHVSMIFVSVILAVISYIFLPENVVTQLSIGSAQPTTMPKLVAIFIPFAFGVGGGIISLANSDKEKIISKNFWVSVVGIALFILMLAVNISIQ